MFEPITKRSKQILLPGTVPEVIRIAFKYAESEKPGAVHVDLPNNIAKLPAEGEPLKKIVPGPGLATFESIEKAAIMISRAVNPLILVGADAIHANASKAVTEMAEQLKIPVVNTMMAKGMIPYDNKYSMWTIGIPQRDYVNKLFDMADLVVAIGYDIVEFSPVIWNKDNKINIIHIGHEVAHVNKNYQPKIEVIGDMRDSIFQIIRRSARGGRADLRP